MNHRAWGLGILFCWAVFLAFGLQDAPAADEARAENQAVASCLLKTPDQPTRQLLLWRRTFSSAQGPLAVPLNPDHPGGGQVIEGPIKNDDEKGFNTLYVVTASDLHPEGKPQIIGVIYAHEPSSVAPPDHPVISAALCSGYSGVFVMICSSSAGHNAFDLFQFDPAKPCVAPNDPFQLQLAEVDRWPKIDNQPIAHLDLRTVGRHYGPDIPPDVRDIAITALGNSVNLIAQCNELNSLSFQLKYDLTLQKWFEIAQHSMEITSPTQIKTLDAARRLELASDKTCGWELLEALAVDSAPAVRAAVAENAQTRMKILKQMLAVETDATVKNKIEAHISKIMTTPSGIEYMTLAEKKALAANPNSSQEMIEALANDSEPEIRQAVAKHPKTSSGMLQLMAKNDPDSRVRDIAAARIQQ